MNFTGTFHSLPDDEGGNPRDGCEDRRSSFGTEKPPWSRHQAVKVQSEKSGERPGRNTPGRG